MGDDSAAKSDATQPTTEVNTVAAVEDSDVDKVKAPPKPPTSVWRCITGSAIAAVLAYGAYNLTFKIATQFASHPLVSDNYIAVRLSGMVRTLVLGVSAMATGIFSFAALGLAVLGLQIALQKLNPGSSASS